MKIIVKNMVCPCCELQVRRVLADMGLKLANINGAELTLAEYVSAEQLATLDQALGVTGLGLVDDPQNAVVERVKGVMNALVNMDEDPFKTNLSSYLSKQIGYNYSYLSNLFSKVEGQTIRNYAIGLRIERAKRMLMQEQMDLPEVSAKLHYSSTAHLATQFKKVTGMTTTAYKRSMESPDGFSQQSA